MVIYVTKDTLVRQRSLVRLTSGYGIQSRYLLPRFQKLGHAVAVHAWYGLQGGILNLDGMTIYPQGIDTYGNDIVEAHAAHFKADIVISLMDVWVLHEYGKKNMRWIPYMPIDSEPIPQVILHALQGAYRVCSYSRYGEKSLNDAGIINTYIPHGVDTNAFKPTDKAEAKARLGFKTDDFVIGMVAANKGVPSRKAFPENLQAVAALKARHPNVKLYLHTLASTGHAGIDFDALLKQLGFRQEEVKFCNQYKYMLGFSEEYMVTAYNAMDVMLGASMSEGFGIPLIEAQSCGTPVIVTRFSSMPELVFGGWIAEVAGRFWTPLNTWMVTPSVDSILGCLEEAYQCQMDVGLAKQAREGALAYDWETIIDRYWKPFLEDISAEIDRDTLARAAPNDGRIDMCKLGHDWFPTGIWDYDGLLHVPCKRPACAAVGTPRNGRIEVLSEHGFETVVNDVALDLEDDPQGGVVKVVCQEIRRDYALDEIPFKAGDVAIDIGAQVGVVSCYLGKIHPEIRIYAYEPDPANFARLKRNLGANHITNVVPVNRAVTADGRRVQLYGDHAQNSGGLSLYSKNGNRSAHPEEAQEVDSTTLLDILESVGHDRVHLLKIDAEGAEYEIIGDGTALDRIDYLRGEFHFGQSLARHGWRPDELIRVCEQHINPEHVKVKVQNLD